jgi:hypothetical protein
MEQTLDSKIENLNNFLKEDLYKRTVDELKELDSDFKDAAKRSDSSSIANVVLSEDLEMFDKLCKKHEGTPLGALMQLFYLAKKISTNIIWTGFNIIGAEQNQKMLITLRPIRTNMNTLALIEQIYSVLSKDFKLSTALVVTKYEINNNFNMNSKILTEGLVSVVKTEDNRYDLYFFNMFDKTEFDILLSTVLGMPTYMSIIKNSHHYFGSISEFSKDLKQVANNIVTDDLMMQSNPIDVLRWFNSRMTNKNENIFGVKFCSVTGIPLAHFGDYHDNDKSKFYQ